MSRGARLAILLTPHAFFAVAWITLAVIGLARHIWYGWVFLGLAVAHAILAGWRARRLWRQ